MPYLCVWNKLCLIQSGPPCLGETGGWQLGAEGQWEKCPLCTVTPRPAPGTGILGDCRLVISKKWTELFPQLSETFRSRGVFTPCCRAGVRLQAELQVQWRRVCRFAVLQSGLECGAFSLRMEMRGDLGSTVLYEILEYTGLPRRPVSCESPGNSREARSSSSLPAAVRRRLHVCGLLSDVWQRSREAADTA